MEAFARRSQSNSDASTSADSSSSSSGDKDLAALSEMPTKPSETRRQSRTCIFVLRASGCGAKPAQDSSLVRYYTR